MPMELRKRKAVEPAPAPAPKKPSSKVSKVAAKVKAVVTGKKESKAPAVASRAPAVASRAPAVASSNGSAKAVPAAAPFSTAKPSKGDVITLEGFGGEVETNDGQKVTLKSLVDASKAGVVLFTYPKASTPGCTTQACLFRDSYAPLTAGGLAIYGLSADSPKANTTFQEKQKLPYPLLCDPSATLIEAIGLKKTPKGTQRGVFVVDKTGKVLAAEPGGPAGTVDVVKKLVAAEAAPKDETLGDAKVAADGVKV